MRKLLCVSLLLLLAVAFMACGTPPAKESLSTKTLQEFYPEDISNVDSIEIVDGSSGKRKQFSDKQQVQAWINQVKDIKFEPDPNQEDRSGFLFAVSLFEGQEKKLGFSPNSIRGHYYIHNEELFTLIKQLFEEMPREELRDEQQGIEMKIEKSQYNKSVNEIVLEIKNNGSEEVMLGNQYIIEMNENGIWSAVPFQDNIAFTDEGILLKPNNSYEQNIRFNNLADPLIEGKYRVVKDFYLNGNKITLASEFEITDSN